MAGSSCFIRRTSPVRSPLTSLVLLHEALSSVREKTTLGCRFMPSATAGKLCFACGVGQKLSHHLVGDPAEQKGPIPARVPGDEIIPLGIALVRPAHVAVGVGEVPIQSNRIEDSSKCPLSHPDLFKGAAKADRNSRHFRAGKEAQDIATAELGLHTFLRATSPAHH